MKKQLTYEQIERIQIGIETLAQAGNPFAQAVGKALEGKTPAEKRNTLAGSYARMFEVLNVMGMAMDSKVNPKLVRSRLTSAQERANGN